MLVSIHDSELKRVAFMDNNKPNTLHYYDDTWHRYLQEATSTFDFTVYKNGQAELKYLNDTGFVSFRHEDRDYLFNIMQIDETEDELTCKCENLNLELLNETSPAYSASTAHTFEEYFNSQILIGGSSLTDLVIGINEVSDYSRKLSWDGTDTKLARLLSLANMFDAEIEFVTELNGDGSMNRIVMNVYHEQDDDHQGVGTRRNDVLLNYGKNISRIRRTVDKAELFTAIRPHGTDGLTISSVDETVTDEYGGVLYFTETGSSLIYAPQAAAKFPSHLSADGNAYIIYDWDYDTTSVNMLYGQALGRLKQICEPAISYEVEGLFDLDIGDTVHIRDDKFDPVLLLEARVSEQEICFTDPSKSKTVFANFKALENRLSGSITSRMTKLMQQAEAKLPQDHRISYAIGDSATLTPLTGWQDTPLDTTAEKPYLWIRNTTVYKDGSEDTVYSISKRGDPGADGVSVSDMTPLYYCTSSINAPQKPTTHITEDDPDVYNAWNRSVPTYTETYRYYFTCYEILYSDTTRTWSDVVYDSALGDALTMATEAMTTATSANDYADTVNNGLDEFRTLVIDDYVRTDEFNTTVEELSDKIDPVTLQMEDWSFADQDGNVFVNGAKLYDGSVDVKKLNVLNLAAISANLGTVTSGMIKSPGYDDGNGVCIDFTASGATAGFFIRSSDMNTLMELNGSGSRIYPLDDLDHPVAEFTDFGANIKSLVVSLSATIAGLSISQPIPGEVWVSGPDEEE